MTDIGPFDNVRLRLDFKELKFNSSLEGVGKGLNDREDNSSDDGVDGSVVIDGTDDGSNVIEGNIELEGVIDGKSVAVDVIEGDVELEGAIEGLVDTVGADDGHPSPKSMLDSSDPKLPSPS